MPSDTGLIRSIGARRLTAMIVNATVGAGIFVLPATAAAELGPAAPFAYIVCALAMAGIVTCIAAAGSRVAATGGIYAYTAAAFGPFAGFLAGVLTWVSSTFGVAGIASALMASLAVTWAPAGDGAVRLAIMSTIVAALAGVNVRGVSPGGRLIEVMTAAKLLPLAVLVAAGLWFAPVNPATWLPLPEPAVVGRTAILLIFAFLGIELAILPSGEIRDPAKTLPRAIFLALTFTTVLYLTIQTVVQGVLGADMADSAAAPLAAAAARLLGRGGETLVLAGAAVSMFGYMAGDMLSTPRALFALARDGFLPKALGDVHQRFRTPWLAIWVHAAIVIALAAGNRFAELIIVANVSTLLLYLSCVAAAYRLQQLGMRANGAAMSLPAGPLIPVAAIVLIVWLLAQATAREFIMTGGFLAVAAAMYAWKSRGRPIVTD
jgi:APA family basic amino acid/polyamine antiporter